IDERQRLARERREEQEKQNVAKEAQWQAREERARQHYEKQLEERKKKLEDQRIKEEKRRAAVEEKRRQKQEEDRVRHEAVIRRTLERSQKTRPKQNRWSWGGALHTNTPNADRRSVSTVNLSKHTESIITKRLSSSSATLLHSPDRGLRRLPLTPWESSMVNRLQQPTHSYLARSRSAMSLSGEQSGNTQSSPWCFHSGVFGYPKFDERLLTITHKSSPVHLNKVLVLTLSSNITFLFSFAHRPPQKTLGRPPTPKLLKSPVSDDPGNLRPVRITPEHSQPSTPTAAPKEEEEEEEKGKIFSPPQPRPQYRSKSCWKDFTSSPPTQKPSAGTTDPEEASRILTENRRLAREQREREEEERRQQEEQARYEGPLRTSGGATNDRREKRRPSVWQRRGEGRRRRRERLRRRGFRGREKRQRDSRNRSKDTKEEEESRLREEAERLRQEREKHFQKEEAERLERKKRLEEIMKRTRRSDTSDKVKAHIAALTRGGVQRKQITPLRFYPVYYSADGNIFKIFFYFHSVFDRENGEFEEVISLPSHSRLSPPEGEEQQETEEEESKVSVVAFMENGLLKSLSAVEDISAQQGPGQ
uniref:Microtubule-associated protein 7a n=1 Tax=Xiphophorus couchianus TaxID=32473 RepID=A0A3B5LH93_9TELE